MGVATAIVAGAAVAATAASAAASASGAKKAQKANMSNAQKQQKLEERLFHEGRGSQGHAILPEYGGDFEKQLFTDTAAAYRANLAFQGSPESQLAANAEIRDRFQPAFDQGSDVVDSIYSGAMQDQRLAEAQPVLAARTAVAKTQKQGILDDISARLGALDAQNARKGFVGTGSAAQGAALRQTIPMYQQAAGVGALANLQNAQQVQGIQDTGRELQLNSLGLPATRAQQAMAFQQLPANMLTQSQASAQQPFSFFRIPVGQQHATPLPQVQAIPGPGQIAGAALGQGLSAYGGYLANQSLVKSMNQQSQPVNPYEYQPGSPYDFSPVPMYGGGYIYG